ncbi:unnamed protein product [Sphagnum compactum]
MAVSMLGACSDLLLQQQQQTVRMVGREQQSCYSSIICCYCNPKSSTHFSRSSQSLAFVSRSRIAAASKEDGVGERRISGRKTEGRKSFSGNQCHQSCKNLAGCSKKPKKSWRILASSSATVAAEERGRAQMNQEMIERAKMELLQSVLDTDRGSSALIEKRAIIEEAMVELEKFDAGLPLNLEHLDGTWLLQYTTAPDVISLLQASQLPFLQVGQVYQQFMCRGSTQGGTVKNIVRWSIPGLLQENEGATLIVTAQFSVASSRSIVLQFQEARVGEVEISADLQAFLAPAFLPRTFLNLQILQFLRSLDVRVPLAGRQIQSTERAPIGLRYYLTFLDNNMLLGRALGSGGVFIFSRTQSY